MTVDMFSRWRVLVGLSFLLAGTAIAVASLAPHLRLPGGAGFGLVFHGAAYGTLVVLGGMLWRRLHWVAVAVFVYSTLFEGLQYFVPGRLVQSTDLAANVVGILAGLVIVALWRRQQPGPELEDKVL